MNRVGFKNQFKQQFRIQITVLNSFDQFIEYFSSDKWYVHILDKYRKAANNSQFSPTTTGPPL